MKLRRIVLTLVGDSTRSSAEIKEEFTQHPFLLDNAGTVTLLVVEQVQVNVIKPKAKKAKKRG